MASGLDTVVFSAAHSMKGLDTPKSNFCPDAVFNCEQPVITEFKGLVHHVVYMSIQNNRSQIVKLKTLTCWWH